MSAPQPLPPGTCLTDVWPSLPRRDRRAWIQIVEAEQRAVHAAVRYARAAQSVPGMDATLIHAVLRPGDTPAAARRRRDLERALDGYRVGRPVAMKTKRT